jgi:hypothetical protein
MKLQTVSLPVQSPAQEVTLLVDLIKQYGEGEIAWSEFASKVSYRYTIKSDT